MLGTCCSLYSNLLTVVSVSTRELKAADNGVLTLTKADEAQQVASAAADMKAQPSPVGPSVSLAAKSDILEQQFSAQSELAYAQQVELTNGRCGKKVPHVLDQCCCVIISSVPLYW